MAMMILTMIQKITMTLSHSDDGDGHYGGDGDEEATCINFCS